MKIDSPLSESGTERGRVGELPRFNLLELRAIVIIGLDRGGTDYVTQCVGCLTSIGWVKGPNYRGGIAIRMECRRERYSRDCPLGTLLDAVSHATVLETVKGYEV